jgi:cytochrome P450
MIDQSTPDRSMPRSTATPDVPAFSRWASGDGWLASRYSDVQAILSEQAFGVSEADHGGDFATVAWLRAAVSRFVNGDEHALRRARVVEELAGLRPEYLRVAARQRTHAILTAAREQGEKLDAMSLLARRVPVAALADALGIADPERATEAVIAAAGAYLFPAADAQAQRRADAGVAELVGIVPGAEMDTVVARIALLVHSCDATAGLIGLALLKLQEHPGAAYGWATDALINEVARHTPPLRVSGRVASRRLEFGDCSVGAGDPVWCNIDAANRDPAVFGQPDRFDPTRPRRPSLTFGYGVRPCPGETHALTLAGGVVDAVRDHCKIQPVDEVEYEVSPALRIPHRVYVWLR